MLPHDTYAACILQLTTSSKTASQTGSILWNLNYVENAIREDELTPWIALDRASVIRNRLTTPASYFNSFFGTLYVQKGKRCLVTLSQQ